MEDAGSGLPCCTRTRFPAQEAAFKEVLVWQRLKVSSLMLSPETFWGEVLLAYEIQKCTTSGEVGGWGMWVWM